MKILITLIAFCLANISGIANTATYKFATSGNCYVCKVRIEEAVNKLDGIQSVIWDYNTDVTTVTIDEEIVDVYNIMHTIANVGHDTEWFQADSAAYAFLIGSCCEYERVIDYSKAQVGYLSLMQVWVSVDEFKNSKINIYPTIINDGLLNIINENGNIENSNLTIYNISGSLVFSNKILPGFENSYHLSNIASGSYYAIISDNKKNIFTKKIIVQ